MAFDEILKKLEQKPVKLPQSTEHTRIAPNAVLRCALFAAIQSRDRRDMVDELVYSQSGIKIKYTGKQLNQEDLTLWEALLYLVGKENLGASCSFSAYSILSSMGLQSGTNELKILHDGIIRLTACAVQISYQDRMYFGSLINSGVQDEKTKTYSLNLSKQLIRIYAGNDWTIIDKNERDLLRRKPLALALHGYYSSHKEPYPVKIDTIRKLSGMLNNNPPQVKQKIKLALDALVEIGFLESYSITGDKVSVVKIK